MKIQTQPHENHQVKIIVEIDPDSFEKAKRRAAKRLAQRMKIPGFRPGKAPYAVVVRHAGEDAVVEEALENSIQDAYPKAVEESGVEPYGPGTLEEVVQTDPPIFEFVVPLEPEVELGDYASIRRLYELEDVSHEEVEETLSDLQQKYATLEPVARPSMPGDIVYIRIKAERMKTEDSEDETPVVLMEETPVPIIIEADQEEGEVVDEETNDVGDEWPFQGFTRNLLGLVPGDENSVSHEFPEDAPFKKLAGEHVLFKFVVDEVKARTPPELDDAFASTLGDFEDVGSLREEVRRQLEHQAKQMYDEEYEENLLEDIVSGAEIKFPPAMLENEVETLIHNLEHRLEDQQATLEEYLLAREMDEGALREEMRPVAETRLSRRLALYELAKAEGIEVTPEELQQEATRAISEMSRGMSKEEAKQLSDQRVVSNILNSIASEMILDRSIDRLRQIAGAPSRRPVEEIETEEEVGSEEMLVAEEMEIIEEVETVEAEAAATEEEVTPEPAAEETPSTEDEEQSEITLEQEIGEDTEVEIDEPSGTTEDEDDLEQA